jgi:hypothetical protein
LYDTSRRLYSGYTVTQSHLFIHPSSQAAPAEPNRVQKKKLWEAVMPDLKTGADKVAGYKGQPMMTSAGAVTAASLTGANIA